MEKLVSSVWSRSFQLISGKTLGLAPNTVVHKLPSKLCSVLIPLLSNPILLDASGG